MSGRRLHIGALHQVFGWETLNAQPLPGIDYVCDAADLSRFPDNTFESLYASHVLEHFDYKDVVPAVLKEWFRVLVPAGKLFVSVPDTDAICHMFCDREQFSPQDRWHFIRMLLGGHVDSYDYHQSLFNEEILVYFLEMAGYRNVCRSQEFGLFDDTSSMRYKGELISLNLIAIKPSIGGADEIVSDRNVPPPVLQDATNNREASFSITRDGSTHCFNYSFDTTKPTQRNMASHLLTGSLYEPEIALVLIRILHPGDCFVDVGANVGFFTVIAARLVGEGGRVYAFEPETANFNRLKQNVALNGLTNVMLYQAAVGDRDGEAELYINSDNDGGHALWNPGAHSFNRLSRETVIKQKTPLVKLDTLLMADPEAASRIKAVKIDAEGYEQHVLQGTIETISRQRIPFVFAEINRLALHQSGAGERPLILSMRHLGYSAYRAEADEREMSVKFLEVPMHFIPTPENPETVYNLLFCLPGELEKYGFRTRREC